MRRQGRLAQASRLPKQTMASGGDIPNSAETTATEHGEPMDFNGTATEPATEPTITDGDTPRWISSSRVDSGAMLGAYLSWYGAQLQKPRPLPIWYHAMDESINIGGLTLTAPRVDPPGVVPQSCTDEGCLRCLTKRGGFKFRWFDRAWYPQYERTAKPGAWNMGECED